MRTLHSAFGRRLLPGWLAVALVAFSAGLIAQEDETAGVPGVAP